MLGSRTTTRTTLYIDDTHIRMITLDHNGKEYSVRLSERAELEPGVIHNGDIVQADLLYRVLKHMKKNIPKESCVDVLFSEDAFLHDHVLLDESYTGKTLKQKISRALKQESGKRAWIDTHLCEGSYHRVDDHDFLFFECLRKDVRKSYHFVFEKAGIKVASFSSDVVALGHLLPQDEQVSLMYVDQDYMRVAEFKQGVFSGSKKFAASYRELARDIEKQLNIDEEQAQDILNKYGVLRSHKSEKLYKRLVRSLSPLLDFLLKRKAKRDIYICFANEPLLGFADLVQKASKGNVHELDVLASPAYPHTEVLSLHRKESYHYQLLIAQTLKHFPRV